MFNHQRCSFHIGISTGERELDSLVLADRTIEYHTLFGVTAGALDEPEPIADTLGGDQNTLGIQPIKQITEALAFFADQVLSGDFNVVKENLRGGMVHHGLNRANGKSVASGFTQIHQQDGESLGTL